MFEDDLIVIENSVLCRCKNKMLKILDIPEGTEAIADEVFQNCSGLMAVTLPPTVTKIGENAFEGCSGLCSLELPKTLMHISPNAFSFCDKLQTVQIQNRFIDMDETAFENTVNIIIKAAQYSTSYEFAHRQHFRFTPASFKLPLTGDVIKEILVMQVKDLWWVYLSIVLLVFIMMTSGNKNDFKDVQHGSARWANKYEKKKFTDNTGIPCGDNFYLTVTRPKKMYKETDNLNELVIGGSGAGKRSDKHKTFWKWFFYLYYPLHLLLLYLFKIVIR